jgi:hypothetical protein
VSAAPERLSWRESVAAQLYEIADSWSRGEMSCNALMFAMSTIAARVTYRGMGPVLAARVMREQEWR